MSVIEAPLVRVPVWVLGALTLTGSLAMHIFVPALPGAAAEFGASTAQMEMTISVYILGMALGQLVYGPLSDHFGRRPVLMAALSLYCLAGIACYLAPGLNLLIAARLFQAFGGCAGLVLGRAILRDTSTPAEIASRLAVLTMIMVVGPSLAPLVGGLVVQFYGWRTIYLLLLLIGLANMASVVLLIPETRPDTGTSVRFTQGMRALLRRSDFRWLMLGGACATTSMYGVITAAPFIFERDLHRPAHEVGPWLALVVLAVAMGNFVIRATAGRVSLALMLRAANWMTLGAGLALLAVVLFAPLSAPVFMAPVFVFCLATGVTSPIATSQAMNVLPEYAGAASGLYGFVQMMVAALCTTGVGLGSDPALSAALVTAGVGAVAMVAFRIAARQRLRVLTARN
ncbi:Bcr/CflA family efflux MFS transporter [bacterium]|nr:Bcr/CflA family efflux MFS transporter [bacterium]